MKSFTFFVLIVLLKCSKAEPSDKSKWFECWGKDCPTISLPIPFSFEDASNNTGLNCNGINADKVMADPEDCHQYYFCYPDPNGNGTSTPFKFKCPEGYGYHSEWESCVPENWVKNCSDIFCPPHIYDGVISDPKNCSYYYRCLYGFASREKCPEGSYFIEESGMCQDYSINEVPECVKGVQEFNTTTTTTSTTVPPTTSTLSTTTTSPPTTATTSTTSNNVTNTQ